MSDLNDLLGEEEDDTPTAPFWMATFSDMATLLLTFFVLLVAMSEVEVKKFEEALSYFTGRPSFMTHDAVMPPVQRQQITQFRSKEQAARYENLLEYLRENDLEGKVQVNLHEDGLQVIITDSVMFESGEADLIEPSRTILRGIAEILADDDLKGIIVSGHTDDRPIQTPKFPSNWELSSSRAASVVRFLNAQESSFDPAIYFAVGYGEYHPIDTNRTPAGRSRNRRVEIFFSWKPWQNNLFPTL